MRYRIYDNAFFFLEAFLSAKSHDLSKNLYCMWNVTRMTYVSMSISIILLCKLYKNKGLKLNSFYKKSILGMKMYVNRLTYKITDAIIFT